MLHRHCSRYIVQTSSMATTLRRWSGTDVPISIAPLAPACNLDGNLSHDHGGRKFNFVYVASGEAHKNHANLLEAWRLLAESGIRPSLGLTLDSSMYPELCDHLAKYVAIYGVDIVNVGALHRSEVDALYRSSAALIYPSVFESFGLPLIEAREYGLPILASELDYVRDVARPTETFDPTSPLSIARAVRRFLGVGESPVDGVSVQGFMVEVLR